MLRFAKQNVTPPGSYRYIDADTNQQFTSENMGTLVSQVRMHRKANSLSAIPDLHSVIEDWICQRMPAGICKTESGQLVKHGVTHKTAETSVRATQLIHSMSKRSRGPKPTQEVVEQRAKVCVDCPRNVPFAGCMSCRGVTSIVKEMKRGRKTDVDSQLMTCAICGVLNEIHVFVDEFTVVDTIGTLSDYPDTCWKHAAVEGARENGYQDRAMQSRESGSRSSQTVGKTVLRPGRQIVDRTRPRAGRKPCRSCGQSVKR